MVIQNSHHRKYQVKRITNYCRFMWGIYSPKTLLFWQVYKGMKAWQDF